MPARHAASRARWSDGLVTVLPQFPKLVPRCDLSLRGRARHRTCPPTLLHQAMTIMRAPSPAVAHRLLAGGALLTRTEPSPSPPPTHLREPTVCPSAGRLPL